MSIYQEVKFAVVDVVDDFTKKEVTANYRPSGTAAYSSKTKLSTLGINEAILAVMVIRFNKSLRTVCGAGWRDVGAFDLVTKTTIGDLILLACAVSHTHLPDSEPT